MIVSDRLYHYHIDSTILSYNRKNIFFLRDNIPNLFLFPIYSICSKVALDQQYACKCIFLCEDKDKSRPILISHNSLLKLILIIIYLRYKTSKDFCLSLHNICLVLSSPKPIYPSGLAPGSWFLGEYCIQVSSPLPWGSF